ncbi:DUF2256 domain-containing protein [Acinetobacter junii]|uniref:DUF2256 domain-containing protein n=1 Tax=Acinetobacter junii TaxID=40215 RepID=UPI00102EB363|nr:DUF2256 domain-containing protein [Acinetobacter junii]RZG69599.1 DUF2256 domain-containing protein [Acinetobacter junii]
MHKKLHLPEKICAYCLRPFTWRKKWERSWGDVNFCSQKCKQLAKRKAKTDVNNHT